jgi:hypothetical protein
VLTVDDLGDRVFADGANPVAGVAPERLCALMHTALENLFTASDTAMHQIGVLPDAER